MASFLDHVLRLVRDGFAASFGVLATVSAQEAPPPSAVVSWPHDTGAVTNAGLEPAVVASFLVAVDGAAWLRLVFDEVTLAGSSAAGTGALLRIVSAHDAAEQVLDAQSVAQWGRTSAYFNGDSVLVEIHAEPATGPSRLVLREVVAGLGRQSSALSQCGARDDRAPSEDPRIARLLPSGCTSFLVAIPGHPMLSAGHCAGLDLVLEFEVPPSSAIGTIVHPHPEHQYAVDPLSLQFSSGGLGADWAVFGGFANAQTGLTPFARQQSAFVLAPGGTAPEWTARVTGFGLDFTPPEANQAQQTSTGAGVIEAGGLVSHHVDTEIGNSGSPIEWAEGGVVIGIHTHGGCGATGGEANHGTRADLPELAAALAQPLGVCALSDAPSASTYCVARVNSLGCTPAIEFTGLPSAAGGSGSFTIGAAEVVTHKLGVLVYALSPGAVPFSGGIWCVGAPFVRTMPQDSRGGIGVEDCSGTYSFDMGGWIAAGADPALTAGRSVYAQWWMRDPLQQPFTVGLSDALAFTIGP